MQQVRRVLVWRGAAFASRGGANILDKLLWVRKASKAGVAIVAGPCAVSRYPFGKYR